MGYTHYWDGRGLTIDATAWKRCLDDCAKVLAESPVPIVIEREAHGLKVNGLEGDDYEPFFIPDFPLAFNFCKTAQRSYDVVVVACLCLFSEAGVPVSSDGAVKDWDAGADLATKVLGRTVQIPTTIDLE